MANVYSSKVCLQTKKVPKISKFFFFKNTPKYDKLSKISNISIKTILELRTKFGNFGNFGNFGHISDGLSETILRLYSMLQSDWLRVLVHSLYCQLDSRRKVQKLRDQSQYISKKRPSSSVLEVGMWYLL